MSTSWDQLIFEQFEASDLEINRHDFTQKQKEAIWVVAKKLLLERIITKHSDIELCVVIGCCVVDFQSFQESCGFLEKLFCIIHAIEQGGDALVEQWLEAADDQYQEALAASFTETKGAAL